MRVKGAFEEEKACSASLVMSLWSVMHGVLDNTAKTSSGATWLVSGASLVTGWEHADHACCLQCSEIISISFMLSVVKQSSEAWAAEHHVPLVNKSNLGMELCYIKASFLVLSLN